MKKIVIIAGEPSGDKLGANLISGLETLYGPISVEGVGGPLMKAQGLNSLFDYSELAVMGIAEVVPKLRTLMRRIQETAEAVLQAQPDVLITIDSPDFCLRVAKKVKARSNIPVVHYVAPSVWAWRPGRAKKMARYVDHVLALLPFEPPYMEEAGMSCDFVSHPVIAEPQISLKEINSFRQDYGLERRHTLLLLPGSRVGEVKRHLPLFRDVLDRLSEMSFDIDYVLPMAEPVSEIIKTTVKDWSENLILLDPRDKDAPHTKQIAMAASQGALAVSGTVSLELASQGTPMVIVYKAHWLSSLIARFLVKLDTVTLPNLILKKNEVPEFLLHDATGEKVAARVIGLLRDGAPKQKKALSQAMTVLGRGKKDVHLLPAHSVGKFMGWAA